MSIDQLIERQQEVVITKPVVTEEGKKTVVSFSVKANEKRYNIWFRSANLPNADYSNVALVAALLPAMKINLPLRLEGAVSPKLLEGVSKIQEIFNTWDESYNLTKVIPQVISPAKNGDSRGVACFFSGGVDSFYTLLKNLNEINSIVLIHGFDFKPDFAGREEVVCKIREMAQMLGKTLIEVDTNVRDFGDDYVTWLFYYGSVLGSVASLLSASVRKIFIPSSHSYCDLMPSGSLVLVDKFWSTEGIEVVHDGCEATRVRKVSKLAESDIAMSYLRVCWESEDSAYNCGKCEKCLRTMTNLAVHGALKKCRTFTRPLDLGRVARIDGSRKSIRGFLVENLATIKENNTNHMNHELAEAIQDSLDGLYYKGFWGWPRRFLKLLRRKGKFRHALGL